MMRQKDDLYASKCSVYSSGERLMSCALSG